MKKVERRDLDMHRDRTRMFQAAKQKALSAEKNPCCFSVKVLKYHIGGAW